MKPSQKLSLILTFTMSFLAAGYSQLLGANSLQSRENHLSAVSSKSDSKDGSSSEQDVWVWKYIKGKVITDEKGQKINSYNYLQREFDRAVEKTIKLDIPTVKVLSLDEKNGGIETRINNKREKEILMVTWTNKKYYPALKDGKPETKELDRLTWVTAKPQVYSFCNQTSGIGGNLSHLTREMMLDLRLTQYLGLKPQVPKNNQKDKDSFVEMWVKAKDLKRPCSNESIDTKECSNSGTKKMQQVRKKFLGDSENNYPFTGLGYTYDWGKPSPVGPSEFVIEASKDELVEVEVVSVYSTKDYCKNNKISARE